jgi:hypothetical protein
MTTVWTSPTIISQYSEPGAEAHHVQWSEREFSAITNVDNVRLGLNGTLEHIARSPKHDTGNKTYFLKAQGFNFNNLPTTISGIEVRLSADRRARITDDTIQLLVNDQPVGKNQATLILDPKKIYGGENDTWDVGDITVNSTFGVLIRFQSHPHWPHKDTAYINAVEIRIH